MEGFAPYPVRGTKKDDLPLLGTSAGDAVESLPLPSASNSKADILKDILAC